MGSVIFLNQKRKNEFLEPTFIFADYFDDRVKLNFSNFFLFNS